jgi:hypothetical protein
MVIQFSIFLPNEPGILALITELLGKNDINIRALTVGDAADYGVLRIIVDNPDKCLTVLQDANYMVSKTEVIAVEVEDKPGGLHKIAKLLGDNGVNIDYIYSTLTAGAAVILLRVNKPDKALKLLQDASVKVLENEIYNI